MSRPLLVRHYVISSTSSNMGVFIGKYYQLLGFLLYIRWYKLAAMDLVLYFLRYKLAAMGVPVVSSLV